MNYDSWLLFTSIALIATITPGPAILLVTTHSVSFGTKYSIATMAGNVTGLFIMSLLSVMGLSAIILHSVPIFLLVKGVGAGYLIFLGAKLWSRGFGLDAIRSAVEGNEQSRPRIIKLYFNGLLVALSNPKAIAFTTALFPQFIHPDYPMAQQFCILIATFMFLSFVCLLAYAVMAAETKNRSTRIKLPGLMSKVFGAAFIGSGVFLATATQK
ncbi:MAG: LysE family translocator [Desulfuromonadales bacterium]|jgi:threonine/homoserine/homoserine lactone efflux protein|nr:LysE family translocator [Desulfuromonadales bacterium]MDH3807058.1 LysE family translocator [Desulfuromonadales bacterium]MDH3868542.1 LysE family translocator [Desulfuromonadales bacterium]MDH3959981.1 LysE family translocator [Desulfuromonadales bacterium]MDH4025760.1 LysE family translocator [Desulfuromonadales bacterium]